MPTLTQIRINKNEKEKYELNKKLNYKNPPAINLISKCIKSQNIEFINNYCEKNNINDTQKKEIINTLIKPNYYTPYITNSKSKENVQRIL
tara:strand:+ start:38 stop:310 length:273 start_codon:yes stop_codon:yes gene_type:complete